jgi:type I restriction-modification system DNA methylase subunit
LSFKPSEYDSASTARILYFTFEEYANYWQIITDVFSRQAVEFGGFYRYAEQNRRKRGTQEVDAAFLEQIEGWRDILANNLILRNSHLTSRQLNFTVQQTIDRIVFLRICEDRGIEKYGQLLKLIHSKNIYSQLLQHFYHADARYNSGLFHFQTEQHREQPDLLTPLLQIDDKPLKDILKHLYYPASPYEFSVLSADILGQIYEQFLGKVIHLTAHRSAIVEDKPEVKKAGGVFYTPIYIVDYIVKNTIGVLLADKQLKKPPILKIIDPACGSGSFYWVFINIFLIGIKIFIYKIRKNGQQ